MMLKKEPYMPCIDFPRIGFAGIGLMGLPMCQRLLTAGYPLTVWNRSAEKCQPLITAGAQQAVTQQALVENNDIIMLCLADTAAVEHVAMGEAGLLHFLNSPKIVIDFSSISPAATKTLAAKAGEKNAQWIDAPVSGGVTGAEAGALVIMAGGDESTVTSVLPVLQTLAQRITYMGASGAGQVTKICNQLIVAANAVLIAEAVALAEKNGVDARKLAPALVGGFADSKPFQLLAPRMSTRQFKPVQWRVKTLLKDLDMATALAQCAAPEKDTEHSLAAHAAALLRQHGDNGFMAHDLSSLIMLFSPGEKSC
jgi:3-hydroxyisobutyrate dehydrogenase